MELPNIRHPKPVRVSGVVFEVYSYSKLTDQQAMNVVRQYLMSHRIRKKDKGKVISIHTIIDDENKNLFGD